MKRFVFSNVLGVWVYEEQDGSYKKVDHQPPSKAYQEDLRTGKWSAEEEQVIERNAKHELYFLGWKQYKKPGIKITWDPKKRAKIPVMKEEWTATRAVTRARIQKAITEDRTVIEAANVYDELIKTTNRLSKRLRETVEIFAPEISRRLHSNEEFAQALSSKSLDELQHSLNIEELTGRKASKTDQKNIQALSKNIVILFQEKERSEAVLREKMQSILPNVSAVAGEVVGAQLLVLAGSLKHLSELPSSTIQLLGAEKALFRFLRDRKQRPPKYGVLHEHPMMQSIPQKQRGKLARVLGDKLSIAAKVDYFKGDFIGDKLMRGIEKRFR